MISAPDILMEKGFASLETFGGGITPQQRQALDTIRPYVRRNAAGSTSDASQGLVKILLLSQLILYLNLRIKYSTLFT